jgi:hypothetical protein
MANLHSDGLESVEGRKTQVLIKVRIIVWNLKNGLRKYPQISPIRAPFSHSGRFFSTNSAKTSTIVLGIPRFSARSVIGGYIAAGNNR